MWLRQSRGWFLRGFLPVFHRNKARSSVKWTIRRHISEIPLSTTLNPNQTNKQTNFLTLLVDIGIEGVFPHPKGWHAVVGEITLSTQLNPNQSNNFFSRSQDRVRLSTIRYMGESQCGTGKCGGGFYEVSSLFSTVIRQGVV